MRRVIVALLALVVLSGPVLLLVSHVVIGHERARIHAALADVPAGRVAIVPGAQVLSAGAPSTILRDRLQAALELYRAGKVQRILVSGDHGRRDYDEPDTMRDWLVGHGVPAAAIVLDHAGFRTLDTMQRAAQVFGVRAAVVCTQAFHLPRALYLARHAGIDAVGFVADRQVYSNARSDAVRETFARALALVDVTLGRGPRFSR